MFRHSGMPLRVVAEFGHWRRVEDQDGAGGWVHYAPLSGVRTAIVQKDMIELKSRADDQSSTVARAEAGAIVRLHECNTDWCRASGGGEKGWVRKTDIWGVDADEIRDRRLFNPLKRPPMKRAGNIPALLSSTTCPPYSVPTSASLDAGARSHW
ncbi:SH3 domain-containing protein [Paracoccus sp. DMF-8]|uniref:SH3 domain-containing protein n=1 Tax=Paracoccus sp. DMF-8 TaxID=3019445 RepID=UPI0023E374B9|nr:SH3 domain-containing protein [Paracoccus sp. DMF-8]MDF3607345.1 SH3 domain-containing protein [Paracoccus sp. DMF-8]